MLLIDQKARDFQGIMMIYFYLKKMGCRVILCNKRNMLSKYEYYHPDIVAFSDTGFFYADWCRYMSSRSKIVLLSQEGGITEREHAVKRFRWSLKGSEPFTKGVAKVFLWGQKTADWLLEDGIFNEEQLVVTGSPRMDLHRIQQKTSLDTQKLNIGFANRGNSINPNFGSVIEDIDSCKYTRGSVVAYTGKDHNWEDWIWHSAAQMRQFFIIIDQLNKHVGNKIYFRPDPFENIGTYKYATTKYNNFFLNTDLWLSNYLQLIDVLITEFSTTGVEMLMLNKPVISIQKIIGPRLLDHNNNINHVDTQRVKLYWQPESVEECMDMIERKRSGLLPFTPNETGLKTYLKDFYDLPRKEPSSFSIAKEIAALLELEIKRSDALEYELANISEFKSISRRLSFLSLKQKQWVFSRYYLLDLFQITRDLFNKNYSKIMQKEYYPWVYGEYSFAKKQWKAIEDFDRN